MMQLIDQVKKIETYICEYFEDWDLDDPVEEGYLEDYQDISGASEEELQRFEETGKKVAAICAAPIALNRAGLLEGRNFTCYDGVQEQIADGHYHKETVVVDGNIITSRGPATALAFAYHLVETLGGDAESLRNGMLYTDLFEK